MILRSITGKEERQTNKPEIRDHLEEKEETEETNETTEDNQTDA